MGTKLSCTSPTMMVTDAHIKGGIQYTHTINNDQDLQVGQVTSACIKFNTDLSTFQLGTVITYYDENIYTAGAYVKRGKFTVDSIEKQNDFYIITAYDDICKFDIKIDNWISTKNNITIKDLFQQLCSNSDINVPYVNNQFENQSFKFYKLKNVTGMTGRGLLQYISAIAGGYIQIHTDDDADFGKVEIAYYKPNSQFNQSHPVDASNYTNLTVADFTTPQITAVRCTASDGDCIRPSTNSAQELAIGYNPILNLRTTSDIQGAVVAIYNKVASYGTYTPAIFEMYADPGINCGDIIYIKYARDGALNTSKLLVMTKEVTDGVVKFSGTGNSDRQPVVTTQDDKIKSLLTSNLLTDNNYISYNFFTNNTTKVFNSNIQCNDILINGLGYPGNTSNKSLLSVIQYILTELDKKENAQTPTPTPLPPAIYHIDLDQADWGRGYTLYNTSYATQSGRTVTPMGCVDYDDNGDTIKLFCDNPDYRTAPTDGTVEIDDNGDTVAYYYVSCYTATGPRGGIYYMEYPSSGIDYESTYYKIWINGTLVAGTPGGPRHSNFTDPNNCIFEIYEENIEFTPCLAGDYIVKFYDPVEYRELYVYKMKFS